MRFGLQIQAQDDQGFNPLNFEPIELLPTGLVMYEEGPSLKKIKFKWTISSSHYCWENLKTKRHDCGPILYNRTEYPTEDMTVYHFHIIDTDKLLSLCVMNDKIMALAEQNSQFFHLYGKYKLMKEHYEQIISNQRNRKPQR